MSVQLPFPECHAEDRLQPLVFGFESLMVNEFHTLNGTCSILVPQGPGYENVSLANQVCTTVGAQPGMPTVDGNVFAYLSYGYQYSDLWRVRLVRSPDQRLFYSLSIRTTALSMHSALASF